MVDEPNKTANETELDPVLVGKTTDFVGQFLIVKDTAFFG